MVILIEHHDENGVSWGVSFDGYNPDPENLVLCSNERNAVKLQNLINGHIRTWYKGELKKSEKDKTHD